MTDGRVTVYSTDATIGKAFGNLRHMTHRPGQPLTPRERRRRAMRKAHGLPETLPGREPPRHVLRRKRKPVVTPAKALTGIMDIVRGGTAEDKRVERHLPRRLWQALKARRKMAAATRKANRR